jgi:hypothetical protein
MGYERNTHWRTRKTVTPYVGGVRRDVRILPKSSAAAPWQLLWSIYLPTSSAAFEQHAECGEVICGDDPDFADLSAAVAVFCAWDHVGAVKE